MSEVSSARKRGLRALLSVSSPVPSATARVYCSGTRRVCKARVCEREGQRERVRESQSENEREGEQEGAEE